MSTYKKTGFDGMDYAFPGPPHRRPPMPPPPPAPPVAPWDAYPFYPPFPDIDPKPVPTPPIPGLYPPPVPPYPVPPLPPCPPPFPPRPIPPIPPCPPPPYPIPRPEKADQSSKRLAQLSQKAKVLVQMIKDFEANNKPAVLTIGHNSYQFGTERISKFGETNEEKGMYSGLISGNPIQEFKQEDYETDETGTRVYLKNAVDLLQSELARVRLEITLITNQLNNELPTNDEPAEPGVVGDPVI